MNQVDAYIKGFPNEVQERLTAIRNIIIEIAPKATERICMRMPTYDLNGKWLVHFAGFQKHISLYPQPEGITAFKEKLTDYKTSKGTVQFPLSKPLPLDLIREIVAFRVDQQSK
ncbi:MAG: iron chaperone [Chitinophagales bacterium]